MVTQQLVEPKGSPRKITRIFGEFYDVTHFNHPGGSTALSLCVNIDATELFHSCHQFADEKKVKAMLETFRITPTEEEKKLIPNNDIFDWKETVDSPFYKELRELCDPIFKKHGTKQTWHRTMEIAVMMVLLIWQYSHFIAGYYHSLFTVSLLVWLLSANQAHDGGHFSISKHPWINDLCTEWINFNTPVLYWHHRHTIGHHCFTNIFGKDPDVSPPPVLRFHPKDTYRAIHRYQPYLYPILVVIRYPVTFIRYFFNLRLKQSDLYPNVPVTFYDRIMLFVRTLAIVFTMYILPFFYHGNTWKGWLFAILPHLLYSMHFGITTSFNHQHSEIAERSSTNFYIHQISSSQSVNCTGWNYWIFLYTGGLCYQIEHHLFPTVNHAHLWRIQPIVQALCKKYNIPYQIAPNLSQAVIEVFHHIKDLSVLKTE